MTFNRTAIYWYVASDVLRARGFTALSKKLTQAQEGIPSGNNVALDFTEAEMIDMVSDYLRMLTGERK